MPKDWSIQNGTDGSQEGANRRHFIQLNTDTLAERLKHVEDECDLKAKLYLWGAPLPSKITDIEIVQSELYTRIYYRVLKMEH
jgi:hypothetical protein